MACKRNNDMKHYLIIIGLILHFFAGNASAKGCENNVVFDGGGAGQVVFNVTAHTSKGITCADCHEGHLFSFSLFEMKTGADNISMRNMELGSYCGHCHDGKRAFSVADNLACSKCHRK